MAKNQKNKDAVYEAMAKVAGQSGVNTKNAGGQSNPENDTLDHFGMKTPEDYRVMGNATIVQNDHFREGAFIQMQINGDKAHEQAPEIFQAVETAARNAGMEVASVENNRFQRTAISVNLDRNDIEGSRKRFAAELEKQVSKPGAEASETAGKQAGKTHQKAAGK